MTIEVPDFKFEVGELVAHKTATFQPLLVIERHLVFDTVGELGKPMVSYVFSDSESNGWCYELELVKYDKNTVTY
jgi:hypothetical protein